MSACRVVPGLLDTILHAGYLAIRPAAKETDGGAMDGIHDMGGMHGFGPIEIEENEPAFHEPWEGRVMGIARTLRPKVPGGWRYQGESLDPAFYLASSYYEKWLHARINGLIESGEITEEEFSEKLAHYRANPDAALPEGKAPVDDGVSSQSGSARKASAVPDTRFAVGDRVRARQVHPQGHTRLPRYLRGKVGEVIRIYRPQRFLDHEPMGDYGGPQPMYAVRFDGREVWGESAEPNSSVLLDMWEAYIDNED